MRITRFALLLLAGTLWAQQATPAPAAAAPLDPSTPIITINGLCAPATPAADCKTVVTKAEFDKLLEAAGPNMPTAMRRQAAEQYAHMLVRSQAAEGMGLQNSPKFEQQMKLRRLQTLAQFLVLSLQENAANVPDADIEKFYNENKPRYEQVTMERIYVPKTRVHPPKKPVPGKAKQDDDPDPEAAKEAAADEAFMKTVAEELHKRAAAGEKFDVLEKEAMAKAGSPGPPPNTAMGKMSRGQLPQTHGFVFDLNVGQISDVIADPAGFYVYHVLGKEYQPLATVGPQIKAQLQSQRANEALKKVDDAAKIEVNDAYFGPPGAGMGPHAPAPKPVSPAATPQPKK